MTRPLRRRRVVTTRDERGRLDALLAIAGADVVHVPLIEIVDAPDGEGSLTAELGRLHEHDWLVVTSRHGAERVGEAAARHPDLLLGAVGRRTAKVLADLAGRAVDAVPDRQTAADLADAIVAVDAAHRNRTRRVLVAQADRADDTLATRLRAGGFDVHVAIAYSTRLRAPSTAERRAVATADAVAFASGSAAEAWSASFGVDRSPAVVVIGPTTAAVATRVGLQVTAVAADHDIDGLAAAVIDVVGH